MSDFSKIIYYDLRWEALQGRLQPIIGRTEELARISRVTKRRLHNNCFVVGPSGIGKTALVREWARHSQHSGYAGHIIQLDSESFQALNASAGLPLQKYKEALSALPDCALVIDDFGQLIHNKPAILHIMAQLLKPLAEKPGIQLVLTADEREYKWLAEQQPGFINLFETLPLKSQSPAEQLAILNQAAKNFRRKASVEAGEAQLRLILQLCERFASLGQLPQAAINILDEAIALAQVQQPANGTPATASAITDNHVYRIVADKTNIPLNQLKITDKELLKTLERDLGQGVLGQAPAIGQIAAIIKRAKLGLKNPRRPLGSFLVLGPSGVGKTETAKLLANKIFGKKESFIRIDMSEFGQAHTVSRLIGAPAGYVGFDAGGGLTNAVKQQPYSLVLLDEIEKANPKIFDIFLQILDDGRLTSGQGETVDFTQTILMATSNLGVREIIDGFKNGEDIYGEDFLRQRLMPALTAAFRLEFLNRFDAVIIFKPLDADDLLDIAKLEIRKIEDRVAQHNIKFALDQKILSAKIQQLADPRFGARPVKRFVEETCETLISQKLLS